ncbi:MAG: HlyD family efflux transporter periplasmic adaptor subunit [Deinococcaceae bacterium]
MSCRYVYILLGSIVFFACTPKDDSKSTTTGTPKVEKRITRVKAASPQYGVLYSNRNVSVTLDPKRKSSVASKASGPVLDILVSEGARVKAGQVVLKLDDTSLKTQISDAKLAIQSAQINWSKTQRSQSGTLGIAQQNLKAAQASLALAKRRFVEGQSLFKAGGLSSVDLQGLSVSLDQAETNSQNAIDQLSRSKRAQQEDLALLQIQIEQAQNKLSTAQKALADTEVKAPFAGVVSEIPINEGEFLAAGNRAFVLADTSTLEAKFKLPPDQADAVASNSTLKLVYGGKSYPIKLERKTTLPGQDRQIQLTALFEGQGVPVGAAATLAYTLKIAKGFLVPSGAVRLTSSGPRVYLVQSKKAVAQSVKVLGEAEGQTAIDGLPKNQLVIYPLPNEIVGGELVEVIP